jgi:hypothetical protein
MNEPQIIATVEKNTLEEVRVALDEFHGIDLIDIRVFADFTGTHAEKRPTKKGISLKVAKLPELIEALEKARAEAERRGLLTADPAS